MQQTFGGETKVECGAKARAVTALCGSDSEQNCVWSQDINLVRTAVQCTAIDASYFNLTKPVYTVTKGGDAGGWSQSCGQDLLTGVCGSGNDGNLCQDDSATTAWCQPLVENAWLSPPSWEHERTIDYRTGVTGSDSSYVKAIGDRRIRACSAGKVANGFCIPGENGISDCGNRLPNLPHGEGFGDGFAWLKCGQLRDTEHALIESLAANKTT